MIESARPAGYTVAAALGKRFELRVFRFSRVAERLQSTADLTFQGTGTRFSDALDRVRDEMSGSAGGRAGRWSATAPTTPRRTLDEAIAGLKSQGMPVFSVGVGKDRLTRDVQITRAETPRRVLKGASLVVDVVVTQSGYAGAKVPLVVEDDGRTVSTQDITLAGDGESETVKVRLKAADAGPRTFRFRVPLQADEEVTQNNQRESLIDVYNRREKILYLEGEPRPEPKFIRHATENDDNLAGRAACSARPRRRSRRRTSTSALVWMRPEELQNGFPTTREELFAYRGIILGSVEASAFTPDQQRMLEDFVDVRGGSLLALGGVRSFSEGGWAGTPLSDALPVVLDARSPKPLSPPLEIVVRPTRAGRVASGRADHRHGRRCAGQVAGVAAAQVVNPSRRRPQAWRERRCSPGSISAAASRWCLPFSGTAAARRSCCPCRTRGSGACTPTWLSRT